MTKHIELMADYNGYMLWRHDPPDIGPIHPEKLPLKPETIQRLHVWAERYNDSLNWDDPAHTEPWSPEETQEFEEEGVRLWRLVREELSPDFEVGYYSMVLERHLKNPDELMPDG